MDRRKFAKTAFTAIAGGALVSTANARPEQVEAVKPTNKPHELNPNLQNDLADEQIRVIQSKRGYRHQGRKGANGKPLEGKCTSLLLFADVHEVYKHLAVIRDFYNTHKKYIDDPIHLGDAVSDYYIKPFDLWDVFPRCLNVIGNHDTNTARTRYIELSDKEKYDIYFKKYIKDWNVIQPENAEAEGKCYWYKDYNNDLRVIGIDSMRVTNIPWALNNDVESQNKQMAWLKATLADAIAKKLKVVIATHVPPTCEGDKVLDCNFSSLDFRTTAGNSNGPLMNKYVEVIDEFIVNGGTFVSWICGHHHTDLVGYATHAKQKQFVIVLECATYPGFDCHHLSETETASCWTLFAVESITNIIKLTRFGNNFDHYMRHKGTLCYDFKNHKLISQY